MPPKFPKRERPSGDYPVYHCWDCHAWLRESETVRWDGRYLCTDCAQARGLAPS